MPSSPISQALLVERAAVAVDMVGEVDGAGGRRRPGRAARSSSLRAISGALREVVAVEVDEVEGVEGEPVAGALAERLLQVGEA
jgi:hypothetical protein